MNKIRRILMSHLPYKLLLFSLLLLCIKGFLKHALHVFSQTFQHLHLIPISTRKFYRNRNLLRFPRRAKRP